MTLTKPILNMAAYAIIFVLILLLGLAVLKSKRNVRDNTEIIDLTGQLAAENKEALDDIDTVIDRKISGKMTQLKRPLENRMDSLRSQNLRIQQQLAALQKKINDSAKSSGDLKWTVNPLTRHRYSLIPYPLPWHYAKQYAEKNGGHLVVINDEKENAWLVRTFGSNTEYWIGLTDELQEGKWRWVNAEEAEYFNWAPPEPDNYRKNQHFGIINSKAPHLNQNDPGKWNDVPGNEIKIGIIERKN